MACCCPTTVTNGQPKAQSQQEVENSKVEGISLLEWLRLGLAFLGTAQVMMFSLAVNISDLNQGEADWLHHILAWGSLAMILFLWPPLGHRVFQDFKSKRITIELFFGVGIWGSYAASLMGSFHSGAGIYYEVPFVLFFIYYLGKILGRRRASQAKELISGWIDSFNRAQKICENGRFEITPIRNLRRGDIIYVAINGIVPIDGKLLKGEALIDESSISGEPYPVSKKAGDRILAGSQPLDTGIEMEVLTSLDEKPRQIDHLLERLRAIDMNEANYQKRADRFLKYFFPIVMTLACLAFGIWTLVASWEVGLYRALTVIVVACPCALGLATPIGLWSGLRALMRRGIIVRSPDFIERLSEVDTVVFDKTGTLSEDRMQRIDFRKISDFEEEKLKLMISAIQRKTRHPIARAFDDWSTNVDSNPYICQEIRILPGKGLEGVIHDSHTGTSYRLIFGNEGLLQLEDRENIKALTDSIGSSSKELVQIFVKLDNKLIAIITLKEVLRQTAQRAWDLLKQIGLDCRIMSGDSEQRVHALQLDSSPLCGLSLEDKIDEVKKLQQQNHRVLFIGDGMNDAGAMRYAHASIAVNSALPVTKEIAGAELSESRLDRIPEAIRISRLICEGLNRNFIFAAAYNLVGASLAIAGWINPVIAAFLMLAASVTVTSRALAWGEKLQN